MILRPRHHREIWLLVVGIVLVIVSAAGEAYGSSSSVLIGVQQLSSSAAAVAPQFAWADSSIFSEKRRTSTADHRISLFAVQKEGGDGGGNIDFHAVEFAISGSGGGSGSSKEASVFANTVQCQHCLTAGSRLGYAWLLPGSCAANSGVLATSWSSTTTSATVAQTAVEQGCIVVFDDAATERVLITVDPATAAKPLAHVSAANNSASSSTSNSTYFVISEKTRTRLTSDVESAFGAAAASYPSSLVFDAATGMLIAVGGGATTCAAASRVVHALRNPLGDTVWTSVVDATGSTTPAAQLPKSMCGGVACALDPSTAATTSSGAASSTLHCVGGFDDSSGAGVSQHWQLVITKRRSGSSECPTSMAAEVCASWTDLSHLVQGSLGASAPVAGGGASLVQLSSQLAYFKGRASAYTAEVSLEKLHMLRQSSSVTSWLDVTPSVSCDSCSSATTSQSPSIFGSLGSATVFATCSNGDSGIFLGVAEVAALTSIDSTTVVASSSSSGGGGTSTFRSVVVLSALTCTSLQSCSWINITTATTMAAESSSLAPLSFALPSLNSRLPTAAHAQYRILAFPATVASSSSSSTSFLDLLLETATSSAPVVSLLSAASPSSRDWMLPSSTAAATSPGAAAQPPQTATAAAVLALPVPSSSSSATVPLGFLQLALSGEVQHCRIYDKTASAAAAAAGAAVCELLPATAKRFPTQYSGGFAPMQQPMIINGTVIAFIAPSSPRTASSSSSVVVLLLRIFDVGWIDYSFLRNPSYASLGELQLRSNHTAAATSNGGGANINIAYSAKGTFVVQCAESSVVAFDLFSKHAQMFAVPSFDPWELTLLLVLPSDIDPQLLPHQEQGSTVQFVATINYLVRFDNAAGNISVFVPEVNHTTTRLVELVACHSFLVPPASSSSSSSSPRRIHAVQAAGLDSLVVALAGQAYSRQLQPERLGPELWNPACRTLVAKSLSSFTAEGVVDPASGNLVATPVLELSSTIRQEDGSWGSWRVADTPMGPLWLLPEYFTPASIAGCFVLIAIALMFASLRRAWWRRSTFKRLATETHEWVDVFERVSGDGSTLTPEECEGGLELLMGAQYSDFRHLRGVQELFYAFDRRGLGFLELSEWLALAEYIRAAVNAPSDVPPFAPRDSPSGVSFLDAYHLSHVSLVYIGMPLRFSKTPLGAMVTMLTLTTILWFVGLMLFERYGKTEMRGENLAWTPRYNLLVDGDGDSTSEELKSANNFVKYGDIAATVSVWPKLPSVSSSAVCLDIAADAVAAGCSLSCSNTADDVFSTIRIYCSNVSANLGDVASFRDADVFNLHIASLRANHIDGVQKIIFEIESISNPGKLSWFKSRREISISSPSSSEGTAATTTSRITYATATGRLTPSVSNFMYRSIWPITNELYQQHADVSSLSIGPQQQHSGVNSSSSSGTVVASASEFSEQNPKPLHSPPRSSSVYRQYFGSVDFVLDVSLELCTQTMQLYRPNNFGRVTFAALVLATIAGCTLLGAWLLTALEYLLKKRHGPQKRRLFHHIRQMAWNDPDAQDDGVAADCAPPPPNIEEEFMMMMARPPSASFQQLLDGEQRYNYSTHGDSIRGTMMVGSANAEATAAGYYRAKWDGSDDKVQIFRRHGSRDKNFTWVSGGKRGHNTGGRRSGPATLREEEHAAAAVEQVANESW